jgi:hypothetical protein
MPKLVSEISAGTTFNFSSSQGQITASMTRVFRVLLNSAGEVFDIQTTCNVRIGDQHPYNTDLYCRTFAAQFEGDSRMVALCTFTYESTAGSTAEDPNSKSPEIRPANWSTSTNLTEVPAYSWTKVNNDGTLDGGPVPAANKAGDRLDGVTRFAPVVSISVEQWEISDPTKNVTNSGCVNQNEFWIGSLWCFRRSLMFRGVTSRPAVESWGGLLYRGWLCTYEFAFQQNHVMGLWDGIGTYDADIGWDLAVPHTGFNVIAFNPAGPAAEEDVYGQPLQHKEQKIFQPLALPDNIVAGDKVRGMVLVHEYEAGGASQLPCAQPIPLNDDGRPRKNSVDPPVLIYRRNPHKEYDFKNFNLRLI